MRDASGRFITEGRRRLCVAVARISRRDAARAIGVTPQFLSMLLSGVCLPSLHRAILIERVFSVECRAWRLDVHEKAL